MTYQTELSLTAYIKQRVAVLISDSTTRARIAKAAGLDSEETLLKVEGGQIKVPLGRALVLADACGEDRRDFAFMAMGNTCRRIS